MPFRKDNNKPPGSSNRFSSLASDKDIGDSLKKKSNRSRKSKKSSEKSSEKTPENSRFKDLETKKNIFSQPTPKENSRWTRDDGDKGQQNRKIHRHEYREERNRRSGFGNRRDDRVRTTERSRERWNKERRPTYRKDDSQYRNRRQRGRINNFTKKPPAFNVEKENFPSLGGKDSASVETKKSEKQQEQQEQQKEKEEQQEDSDKKTIKTYFKDIIKNKKKKFAQAPKYSVEPGWIKMRLSKGKIIKTEGPKVKKNQKPINIMERHRQIMAEMNERHRFNRELDGITLTDILGEDSMLSEDDDMAGYYSGSDNDGMNGAYDNDCY